MVEGQTLILTPAGLLGEGLVEDPYPTYRRFLDAGPAHYVNYKRGRGAFSAMQSQRRGDTRRELTNNTCAHILCS
jgi:hypothetical protein